MEISKLRQLFTLRDLRSAAVGMFVLLGGAGLSMLMFYAHMHGNNRLMSIAAGISLVFVFLILVFVIPPLARNASREASQLDLPFELTIGGAIVLGLIVIVGFSAWNTGNNLLFLVLSFLVGAMAVGFVAGGIALKKLDVKMRFPETIFAGEETPILVSIQNRKRLFPSYSVVVEVRGKERERSAIADDLARILPRFLADRLARPPIIRRTLNYFVHIPRNTSVEASAGHVFPSRGRFLIKDFELSTKFPFGFFRHRRRLPARETDLIVFPQPENMESVLESLPIDSGKLLTSQKGSGQDLLSLRGYQPHDDLRRVDWKATARSQELIVREFAAEDDRRITIFFDTRLPEKERSMLSLREKIEAEQKGNSLIFSDRFENGVSRVASMLKFFTDEQAEIRLVMRGYDSNAGIGIRHFYEMLRRLATVEPDFVPELAPQPLTAEIQELFSENMNSHDCLVTAMEEAALPAELAAAVNVFRF